MTQIDPALTERQQYWLEHIRACDVAGKPSVQYARENSIEVSAMYSACKALAEKGALPRPKPPRFQKAAVVSGTASAQWQIQLPNGAKVGFSGEMDARRESVAKAYIQEPTNFGRFTCQAPSPALLSIYLALRTWPMRGLITGFAMP